VAVRTDEPRFVGQRGVALVAMSVGAECGRPTQPGSCVTGGRRGQGQRGVIGHGVLGRAKLIMAGFAMAPAMRGMRFVLIGGRDPTRIVTCFLQHWLDTSVRQPVAMQPDGGRVVVVGKLDAVPEAAGGRALRIVVCSAQVTVLSAK